MSLEKKNINVPFARGLDQITDPLQVQPGEMILLQNSVFTKGGLLTKRNGFGSLPSLPDTTARGLSSFKGNLVALGTSLQLLSEQTSQWINKGRYQPIDMSVVSAINNDESQLSSDTAVAANGLALVTTYDDPPGLAGIEARYTIIDRETGQAFRPVTLLPAGSINPRASVVGNFFVVTYINGTDLLYISIPLANPTAAAAPVVLSSGVSANGIYDVFTSAFNGSLYFAVVISTTAVRWGILSSTLVIGATANTATTMTAGSLVSITVEPTVGTVWMTKWGQSTGTLSSEARTAALGIVLALTTVVTTTSPVTALTSIPVLTTLTIFFDETVEIATIPLSKSSVRIFRSTITTAGALGGTVLVLRSVRLWSKPFIINGTIYVGVMYQYFPNNNPPGNSGRQQQPTYFIMEGSTGNIVVKLAYGTAGDSSPIMSGAYVFGQTVYIGYLKVTQIFPIGGTRFDFRAGVNLAKIVFNNTAPVTVEIAQNLQISGGFLWMYDGSSLSEQNFHLFPETVDAGTTPGPGGGMDAGTYTYVAVYEWVDANGNIHQSGVSIPTEASTRTVAAGDSIFLNVATLKLTYKTDVLIQIYRKSITNPIYTILTGSIVGQATIPNDPNVDFIVYQDHASESQISGGRILYTTGGVLENSGGPAAFSMAAYKSRLFLVTDEDRNLLWFSKTVIESTPVEMTGFQTIFIAPNLSSQQNAGPIIALCVLDDKLIIFKQEAIYYLTGTGPDITGANNDFSDPNFITSTVGCINKFSLVYTPQGIFFQSDKGIWLLGRDLSTKYIGAPVDDFGAQTVVSALTVPGTNQVRFTTAGGLTILYDYQFNQWGTFTNVPGISSTIYRDLHTFLSTDFQSVLRETEGVYVDGVNPVLIKFTTAWISLAGLQGYERAYFFYLLATWLSPHKLTVEVAFDYDPTTVQTITITPSNFGGPNPIEQWRFFFSKQKCEAFQLTITEAYDPAQGPGPGAGLSISGLNLVVGSKGGYVRLPAVVSAG